MQGSGFRVQGAGCRVQGEGLRPDGLGGVGGEDKLEVLVAERLVDLVGREALADQHLEAVVRLTQKE